MESRSHIFDSTMGACDESSWLDRKVLRRELTDDLLKTSLSERQNRASRSAEEFLDELSKRAQLRSGLERKAQEMKRQHQQAIQRQADEYRERLRRKLRPEAWE